MSSSQLKIDALIGSVSLDSAATKGLTDLGDAIASGFNQAKSAMAAHSASAIGHQQKLSELIQQHNEKYFETERQKLLSNYEFQQEVLKSCKTREEAERNYGKAGLEALDSYQKAYSRYSNIEKERLTEQTGIRLDEIEMNNQKLRQLGIVNEQCLEQNKCLEVQNDNLNNNEKAWDGINKKTKDYLSSVGSSVPIHQKLNSLFRDMLADELWPKITGYFKQLIMMQEDFVTATYRATGSINEHVAAVVRLNRENGMGVEVNKKAYKEVIEMGLQYGSSREELVKLADMHVMTNRVMGVSTEQLAKTTKTFTGLGASIQQVSKMYTTLMYAQHNYGISQAKMNEIINKTNESSVALMTTYGGGSATVESYAKSLALVEGAYGTQAGFHPVVAKGLVSIIDKMKEATIMGGSMMAMFAFKGGYEGADPMKRTEAAINSMIETIGSDQLKDAFGEASSMDLESRKILQAVIKGNTGLTNEELIAVTKIIEKGKDKIVTLDLEKQMKEDAQKKEADAEKRKLAAMSDEERKQYLINKSMETAVKNLSTSFQRLVSAIEPMVTPILDIITEITKPFSWLSQHAPGLMKGLVFTAIIAGALKFASKLKKAFGYITGMISKTGELTTNLNQAATAASNIGAGGSGEDLPGKRKSWREKWGQRGRIAKKGFGLKRMGRGLKGMGGKILSGGKGLLKGGLGFLKSGIGVGALLGIGSGLLDKGTEAADKAGNTGLGTAAAVGSSALSGASTGAMIGSIIPGVGTVIGGAVGGLIGGISGWFSRSSKLKEEEEKKAKAAQEAATQQQDEAKEQERRAKLMAELSTAKKKDRFDLLAEQYNVDRSTAMLIAEGKLSFDEIKERQGKKTADKAVESAQKAAESMQKTADLTQQKAAIATQQEADKNKAIVDASDKIAGAAIASTQASKDLTKQGDATSKIADTTNKTVEIAKTAASKTEEKQGSMIQKYFSYTPLGLAISGMSSMFDFSKQAAVETMSVTKSFMGGGGIFSIFSNLFGDSSKDQNDSIKIAADKIIATLKEIHASEKAETKSIKDILSSISENTDSRVGGNSIAAVWR